MAEESTKPTAAGGAPVNNILGQLARNDVLRQLLILVGIAASVAVGMAAVMWSQGTDYRTLYTSVPPSGPARLLRRWATPVLSIEFRTLPVRS